MRLAHVCLHEGDVVLRSLEVRVSHDRLERKRVHAVAQEVQGCIVSQVVGRKMLKRKLWCVNLFAPLPPA